MTEKALEEAVVEATETAPKQSEATPDKAKKMSKQDENWELVTFLNFTWSEATSIKGADRKYLLNKAEEVKLEVLRRRKLEMEQAEREEMFRQQQQAQQHQAAAQQHMNNPPHQWSQQPPNPNGPAPMEPPQRPSPQQQAQQQQQQQQQQWQPPQQGGQPVYPNS